MFKKCIFGLVVIFVIGSPVVWVLGFTTHGVVDSVNTPDPVAPTAIAPTAIAPTAIAPTEETTEYGQSEWTIIPTSTPRPAQ